jgi:hypothetical protein
MSRRYREVSGYLVGSAAFKAVGMGDPHPAGSIPVHLRQSTPGHVAFLTLRSVAWSRIGQRNGCHDRNAHLSSAGVGSAARARSVLEVASKIVCFNVAVHGGFWILKVMTVPIE